MTFQDAVHGLQAGDFSRLAPLFDGPHPQVVRWHEDGLFAAEGAALAEAVTCAAFNGAEDVLQYFLDCGLDPSGGSGTGMNAFHWAANRGQVQAVVLLIRHKAPLETLNMYGGTVLGCVVWSAVNEPMAGQLRVIEILLDAGARAEAAYPSGDGRIDELLRRHGAS